MCAIFYGERAATGLRWSRSLRTDLPVSQDEDPGRRRRRPAEFLRIGNQKLRRKSGISYILKKVDMGQPFSYYMAFPAALNRLEFRVNPLSAR